MVLAAIGVLLGISLFLHSSTVHSRNSQVRCSLPGVLVKQFERIYLFLRRLDHCTFTPEVLLAIIMARILSILAFSTRAIKENRISWSSHSIRDNLSWLTTV